MLIDCKLTVKSEKVCYEIEVEAQGSEIIIYTDTKVYALTV